MRGGLFEGGLFRAWGLIRGFTVCPSLYLKHCFILFFVNGLSCVMCLKCLFLFKNKLPDESLSFIKNGNLS